MKTISVVDTKISIWDGKVIIDEIREYEDDRGSLVELWREDDEVMNSSEEDRSKMSYWSMTKPYFMRGPHQHSDQIDFFYTFKSKMSYHLYNPETDEMWIYITKPDKVTRVKVAPPIIHSYRNLTDGTIMTANFPSSLFMGENKEGYTPTNKIDEVRWEEKVDKVPVFIVFGSDGRLGKSVTNYLFENMGMHKWDIIPVEKILNNTEEICLTFSQLENVIPNSGDRDVYFINCAAATNVGCDDKSIFSFVNAEMPCVFARECARRKWKLIQISTDYVFQKLKDGCGMYSSLGPYTMSKKEMEFGLSHMPNEVKKNLYVFRVANLFSTDPEDEMNAVSKFYRICKREDVVKVDEDVMIFPTDVSILAKYLVDFIYEGRLSELEVYDEDFKCANLVPQGWNLKDFLINYFSPKSIEARVGYIKPWHKEFTDIQNNLVLNIPSSEMSIINTIEEYKYLNSKKEN